MQSAPAFDNSTLSWVKDEIDLALQQAGAALARHAAAPTEAGPLAEAVSHLHQACGALTIVGLAGVSQVAATLETHLGALGGQAGSSSVAVAAAAGSTLAALRRYLDELMAGHPDQPLRLFPAYRALALAAGPPPPAPLDLFYPDLTRRPPRRTVAGTELTPVRAKALRLGFARGLAKWRGGEARGLTEMRNAVMHVEQSREQPAARALWWVTLAWLDTLDTVDADSVALLEALDSRFAALAEGRADADEAPPRLMTGLLYGIALAPPGDAQRESVRSAYALADLMPPADAGIETRREACRAPLTTAMAEWEAFSQGSAIALMRFHDVALLLAASARDSQDAELARLATAVADFAAWLRQQPERAEAPMALELAAALVLVEDAIEREGARNPLDASLFVAEVDAALARLAALRTGAPPPAPARQRWREQQLVAQVAGEIRANLDAIEPSLDAYFKTRQAPDARIGVQLHQVTGAFQLLDEAAAAQVAAGVEARLAALPEAAACAELAERLTALGQFAATLALGQPDARLLEAFAADTAQPAPPAAVSPVPWGFPAVTPTFAPPPATADDKAMRDIFVEEAREVLATLAATQPVLAANPADRAALTTLRRGFHTLKGSGRMVGLGALAEAAFAVESLLNRWLDERRAADAALLALIDEARALCAQWVEAIASDQPPPAAATLLQRCADMAGAAPEAPVVAVPPPDNVVALPQADIEVGALRLAPTLYRLYVDEAQGHVAVLRSELAEATSVPARELIRAAHTLAGISAGTGFSAVQALAHALENALVRHSLGRAVPDESARMLFARAVGSLEGMVGAIANRRAPAAETALAEALEALQPAPPPTATQLSPLAERRQSRPADEIDPQLAVLFIEEADELLHQLEVALRNWRATPTDAAIGQRMARLLHTFKGSARMCGAMGIGELAHSMETRIEQALAGATAVVPVLDGLDTSLGRAIHLLAELRGASAARRVAATPSALPAATAAAPASPASADGADAAVLLRVRADLIDRLVNDAGEMAIARSRMEGSLKGFKSSLLDLTDNVARLRSQLREFEILAETGMQSRLGGNEAAQFDPLEFDRFTRLQELTRLMAESVGDVATVQHALQRQAESAGEALVAQSRQNRELSHALLRARMVPFSSVIERLHRVVRQTAKALDKQANLDVRGGETPVDRNILERMVAPLEHLLRNAVAHGLEAPAQRRAAGKPECGQVMLDIVAGDNDIRLTLADDGRGLDRDAIRQRARERGLLPAAATEQPAADAALLDELIFRPGFSTAPQVSEIAGRGVGLDVVRDTVIQLGGSVAVAANEPAGTRFTIVLPLTLAVIPVMLVEAAGQRWAIPAALVEEAHELAAEECAARRAAGGVTRSGRHYDWRTLASLYGLPQAAPRAGWQLLLKGGGQQIALEVDALKQNQEVVVKPLGDMLARVPGLTGATVLPDGSVALIANPLVAARQTRHVLAPTAVPPAPTLAAAVPVMVVDDSLTVRKVTGRLLERAGYRTLLAKDGVDALEQLEHERPAVLLADIEMPRMDGFELVRALRADARFAALPVIMITSRSAERHRRVAAELGVRHYLGKPYDEAELLALIESLRQADAPGAADA